MAASVCLYSVYRKQERSLFTAASEQTSNVPTAIIRPRPMAGLWSPIPSIQSTIAPSVMLHVCFLTGAPRRRRPGRCPPFHVPIPPATSTDCPAVSHRGGGGDSRPVIRGPMAVAFPSRAPPYPPPRQFWVRHCRLC